MNIVNNIENVITYLQFNYEKIKMTENTMFLDIKGNDGTFHRIMTEESEKTAHLILQQGDSKEVFIHKADIVRVEITDEFWYEDLLDEVKSQQQDLLDEQQWESWNDLFNETTDSTKSFLLTEINRGEGDEILAMKKIRKITNATLHEAEDISKGNIALVIPNLPNIITNLRKSFEKKGYNLIEIPHLIEINYNPSCLN